VNRRKSRLTVKYVPSAYAELSSLSLSSVKDDIVEYTQLSIGILRVGAGEKIIGFRAMGLMLFPILGLVLLAILFVSAIRARASWSLFKRLGVIVICVFGAAYLVSDIGFHVSDFSRIRNLRQEDLAQVQFGEHVLTSPQDIAAICSTLRKRNGLNLSTVDGRKNCH